MTGLRFIECEREGAVVRFAASNSWTSRYAADIEAELESIQNQAAIRVDVKRATDIAIDVSGLKDLDTYGAWLLQRLKREHEGRGRKTEIIGISERNQNLLGVIEDVNKQAASHSSQRFQFSRFLKTGADAIASFGADLLAFANMLGALTLSLLNILKNPRRFRFTSAVHQLDKVAWQAVPIILLITVLIGGIIAQQGFFHFKKFGADLYVVDMVGILVLREVGILLVAIMVAGRSGSAYTAELGSMKMREEIDALRTMGFNSVEVLILPRVLVLVCAMPILTFLGSMAALYGGGLVAWLYGGMSPEIFIQRLKEAISMTHFKVGMIKAPFMGLVIGLVACTEGLRVKGSAESLGQQTTKSVVKAIFMVIVLDGFFAIFFASIGM